MCCWYPKWGVNLSSPTLCTFGKFLQTTNKYLPLTAGKPWSSRTSPTPVCYLEYNTTAGFYRDVLLMSFTLLASSAALNLLNTCSLGLAISVRISFRVIDPPQFSSNILINFIISTRNANLFSIIIFLTLDISEDDFGLMTSTCTTHRNPLVIWFWFIYS